MPEPAGLLSRGGTSSYSVQLHLNSTTLGIATSPTIPPRIPALNGYTRSPAAGFKT